MAISEKAVKAKAKGYKGTKKTVAAAFKAWEKRFKKYGKTGISKAVREARASA